MSHAHAHPVARTLLAAAAVLTLLAMPLRAQQDDPASQPASEQPQTDPLMDWGDAPARRQGGRAPGDFQGRNPTGQPEGATPSPAADPMVSFGVFSEPMQLTTLIDFVGTQLGLNIVVKGAPTGEVVFNAPVEVPQSKLLDLLDAMLEQYGFTITHEEATGFYVVQPVTDVRPNVGGERASVRIIPTPNLKPSQLVPTLSGVILGSGTNANAIQAVDELGVLIVSAPSRDIARVQSLVDELMRIDAQQQYIRFELSHIAAPAAMERAINLVSGGSGTQSSTGNNLQVNLNPNRRGGEVNPAAQLNGSVTGTFSNLADRLTVDRQGNALVFRGTPIEAEKVRAVLKQIDVPNKLQPKNYFAGSAAAQIADIASRRGLGEVIQISSQETNTQTQFGQFFRGGNQNNFQQQADSAAASVGGPVMVVDISRGSIVYYGTDEQQNQLGELMDELKTSDEIVVIREYVLNHSDAETVADLLTSLITGERQTGDSPLLPTSNNGRTGTQNQLTNQFLPPGFGAPGGDDVSATFDPNIVVVLADPDNNQVIVKAPIKQQDELAKLIDRLDRRRAQVYIQAYIVAVTDNEDFTLGFETQIQAGQFGLDTDFQLGTRGTGGNFQSPKLPALGLGGLTAAVIKSDYVPIIINASQTNSDVRILSSPQLLVNDNEEAEIVSIDEEPYTEVTNDGGVSQEGFAGFAEAGTTLRVTPSISDGGFLRLEYYVELSNFTDTVGSPPPRATRKVTGKATIPSDATIVVGGLEVEDIRNSIAKIPLIGDIPLIGELFKRTDKVNNKAKLYVFLTPRIMTDPNFNDLKLLTRGPQAAAGVNPDAPELEPEPIRSSLPPLPNPRAPLQLEPAKID